MKKIANDNEIRKSCRENKKRKRSYPSRPWGKSYSCSHPTKLALSRTSILTNMHVRFLDHHVPLLLAPFLLHTQLHSHSHLHLLFFFFVLRFHILHFHCSIFFFCSFLDGHPSSYPHHSPLSSSHSYFPSLENQAPGPSYLYTPYPYPRQRCLIRHYSTHLKRGVCGFHGQKGETRDHLRVGDGAVVESGLVLGE